jgi:type I restriction-modification system DNA methylase subunit
MQESLAYVDINNESLRTCQPRAAQRRQLPARFASDLKADFILANPPFNMSDWGGENLRQDVRWKFGMPPINNANYAWIQHFLHQLSPVCVAGFVMANGSKSSETSKQGEIRKAIIEAYVRIYNRVEKYKERTN